MKAILMPTYGSPDVLQLAEVEKPTPKENQILVRVHAASVNAMDWRRFTMPMLFRRLVGGLGKPNNPRPGTDVAGTVEAVGNNVTEFQPGDEVFGVAPGAFAEYVCNAACAADGCGDAVASKGTVGYTDNRRHDAASHSVGR
jgi:NADPH:quinone reductase-like Zn-dependent oxidoreductase